MGSVASRRRPERALPITRDLGSSTAMPTPRRPDHGPAHDVLAAEEFGMPAPDPALHREAAHDVLAAEEFGVPTSDPALHHESAHDVLAAEEFGMPARDPALRHGPLTLPSDPSGIAEPHDVLAAEEFALPAGRRHETSEAQAPRRRRTVPAAAALVLVATYLLHKRRT
jgi:hypothetical protein